MSIENPASDPNSKRRWDWIGFLICFALAGLVLNCFDIGRPMAFLALGLGALGVGFGISWMRSWPPIDNRIALCTLGIGTLYLLLSLILPHK